MKKTKIDWCDCTINPVVGCKNGCKYCYAEKINDRFKFIPCWKEPKFFEDRLKQLKSKKPKSVFIDSMSDIGWWEDEWLEKTFVAMNNNCQHKYIALTKMDCDDLCRKIVNVINQHKLFAFNFYIGKSITTQKQWDNCLDYDSIDFLSIEPLLEPINLYEVGYCIKQVIIGAETGNRKDKVIPKKEWVDNIVKFCDENKIKVFMKESLREIMGNDFRQDKLFWEAKGQG